MNRSAAIALTLVMALACVVNLILGGPNWVAFIAIAIAAVAAVTVLRTDPDVGERSRD